MVVKIAVGPSAPPIIASEALLSKPAAIAKKNTKPFSHTKQ